MPQSTHFAISRDVYDLLIIMEQPSKNLLTLIKHISSLKPLEVRNQTYLFNVARMATDFGRKYLAHITSTLLLLCYQLLLGTNYQQAELK